MPHRRDRRQFRTMASLARGGLAKGTDSVYCVTARSAAPVAALRPRAAQ